MTISRNKREGWYQAYQQGEHYRTFKKRNALRYNYKPGSPAWVQDLIDEASSKPPNIGFLCVDDIHYSSGMRDYILNDDVKYMYPNRIINLGGIAKGHQNDSCI